MQNVVQHVEVLDELEILEHETDRTDAEVSPVAVPHRTDFDAGTVDAALLGNENAGDQIQKGRLARAAGPDHRDFFPHRDIKRCNTQTKFCARIGKV